MTLALAALLHDVGKPVTQTFQDRIRFSGHDRAGAAMAREILTRLRYANEVVENVVSMVAQHMRFKDAPQMAEATFKRFVRQSLFEELLELHRLDLLGGQRPLYNYETVRARRDGMGPEELRPRALLNGRDLIGMGYAPGPRFAVVLQALEDEQLEGRITKREEAERFVRRAWERAST